MSYPDKDKFMTNEINFHGPFNSIKFLIAFFLILLFIPVNNNSQVVRGRVIESGTEKPVEDAFIYLMPTVKTISTFRVSDSTGFFIFTNPKHRNFYIKTTRYGYQDFLVGKLHIPKTDTLDILIVMEAVPILLSEVEVKGKKALENYDPDLDKVGFYNRRVFGNGRFFTREEFKNRSVNNAGELLRGIPGLLVTQTPFGSSINTTRSFGLHDFSGNVIVYLDGLLLSEQGNALGILDMISPNNIKAVEYYKSGIHAPYQFSRGKAGGVLLLWTGR